MSSPRRCPRALSNTATTALLTPIGQGAVEARGAKRAERPRRFESGVLLAIAYGASVGGIATLIGTPPNLLAAGFLDELAGVQVTFTGWILFAAPISIAMLVVTLLVLQLTLARNLEGEAGSSGAALVPAAGSGARTTRASGGPARGGRWRRSSWPSRCGPPPRWPGAILGLTHPVAETLRRHLPEAGVALLCAALLFAAPVSWRKRQFALTWKEGERVNWGILLLFGGGLSLGMLAQTTGLVKWAGEGVVSSGLASSPAGLMLVAIVTATTLSEFASNTASATLLIPIVIAAALQAGFDPVAPALATALATSCAFVFPVSTPPERHRLRNRPGAPHADDAHRGAARRRDDGRDLGGDAGGGAAAAAVAGGRSSPDQASTARRTARTCSGVVPQQPPIERHPEVQQLGHPRRHGLRGLLVDHRALPASPGGRRSAAPPPGPSRPG